MALALQFLEVAQTLVLIFGLVIVYYAGKSYRRTRSTAMLMLAVGFGLASVGSALGGVAFELMGVDLQTADTLQALAQALGFFIILASLALVKD